MALSEVRLPVFRESLHGQLRKHQETTPQVSRLFSLFPVLLRGIYESNIIKRQLAFWRYGSHLPCRAMDEFLSADLLSALALIAHPRVSFSDASLTSAEILVKSRFAVVSPRIVIAIVSPHISVGFNSRIPVRPCPRIKATDVRISLRIRIPVVTVSGTPIVV